MQKDRYKRELESLSAKYDNIYGEEIANLIVYDTRNCIEGKKTYKL